MIVAGFRPAHSTGSGRHISRSQASANQYAACSTVTQPPRQWVVSSRSAIASNALLSSSGPLRGRTLPRL